MNPCSFVAPVFQPARRADWKVGVTAARFMESLHGFLTAHWDHEPSAERVGARASWTAATESSESPLWVGVAVSAARFGILSAARAKAVTSRTPSPQSKTWRQIRRFMERILSNVLAENGFCSHHPIHTLTAPSWKHAEVVQHLALRSCLNDVRPFICSSVEPSSSHHKRPALILLAMNHAKSELNSLPEAVGDVAFPLTNPAANRSNSGNLSFRIPHRA